MYYYPLLQKKLHFILQKYKNVSFLTSKLKAVQISLIVKFELLYFYIFFIAVVFIKFAALSPNYCFERHLPKLNAKSEIAYRNLTFWGHD